MYHVLENKHSGEFAVKPCKAPSRDSYTHFVKKADADSYVAKQEAKFNTEQQKKLNELERQKPSLIAQVENAPNVLSTDDYWRALVPVRNWHYDYSLLKNVTDSEREQANAMVATLNGKLLNRWRLWLEQTYNTSSLTQGQKDILFEECQRTWSTDKQEKIYKKESAKFFKLLNA